MGWSSNTTSSKPASLLGFVQALHRHAQQLHAALGFHLHVFGHHVLVGGHGLVHRPADFVVELLAGHLKHVHAAEPGRGLQVAAGAAVHVQDFAFGVDNHRGRRVLAQEHALDQVGEGAVFVGE
ncbi:hypothetical protein ACFQT0_22330 [Hymenobacter humi]|uniref:Uncharacterized protein n=1 Tax=Hymenobacter humi TaxID=1411620 RepID=A0ABW2UBK0_9BACT